MHIESHTNLITKHLTPMKHFVVKSILNYAVAFCLSDDDDSYGWGNGYVVVPKGHPAYGKHY